MAIKQNYDSNIHVNYVPLHVDEQRFQAEFAKVGKIISIRLAESRNKNYKHGFVHFETVREAQRAIMEFHESNVFGGRPLQVDFWLPQQELEQERKQRGEQDLQKMIKILLMGGKERANRE